MINQTFKVNLPEGKFDMEMTSFDAKDKSLLAKIYLEWRSLSLNLNKIGGRSVNLPDGLSETAFCLEMDMFRTNSSVSGANSSFDVFDLNRQKRVQVKSCSVVPDLTSFGPKSVWDELYFCDFYRNGYWDGTFDIYLIESDLIYNHYVNKTQTVKDQQKQNRRPRFSIYNGIVKLMELKPVKTGNIFSFDAMHNLG